jgi:gentisate 1,2-dioxygenase
VSSTSPATTPDRQEFYGELASRSLAPLWTALHDLVPREPRSAFRPASWRYADIRPLLLRAGELISADEAVRRVLVLENPSMAGAASVTATLYAGFQLLLPGEVAPAHRHTQSALRLVVEGHGAFTTVGGERLHMRPADLILTPSFEWHDHGNAGNEPVIWLDGLDIPLIRSLEAGFAETGGDTQQAVARPEGYNDRTWGAGLRAPRRPHVRTSRVQRFIYPFSAWRPALDAMSSAGDLDESGACTLEFINPVDAGPIMPTISAFCHLLRKGQTTRSSRRTDGVVYHVVEGEGIVKVGDLEMNVAPHDTVVVPPWHHHQLGARSSLVLFSFSDRAAQEQLGIWKYELGESR